MSATNGSAWSLRSRGRLIGCLMALALLASALLASSASAKTPLKPTAYVAIGDSLAFGYTQEKFDLNYPAESPSAFEGGYVNAAYAKLAKAEKAAGNGLSLIDLGCPGETSDGMIGHNVALGGGAGAEYNPCGYHAEGFPLHTEYASLGGESQLEAAIGAVSTQDVTAVSINMGSNDELQSVGKCENPTYLAENGFSGGLDECLVTEVGPGSHQYPGLGVFGHIITNIGDVIGVLRHVGYTGPVVILGFYNPQAEILPGSDGLQKGFNETFESYIAAKAFGPGVSYANPFPLVNPQNKNESAHICKYTEECNLFDRKIELEKIFGHAVSAGAEQSALEAGFEASQHIPVPGDIHMTPAGYSKVGALLFNSGL